ncbi:MAG: dihydroorotase [Clostridiales bacterium]|nr:MAG: dihydroorotase [Clostridiales bacterium]HJA30623.1 dihydroorotase [Candidatus Eisenbergiella pullicola]
MLLIRNCHLIDPASGTDGMRDILVEGEQIRSVARPGELPLPEEGGGRVIHADGLIAAPGLVDTHVHFRDPGAEYKEDIFTGAASAAAGGVTSVVLMANTTPRVDNEDTLRYVMERGEQTGIRVYTCANVTMDMAGDELTDMDSLLRAGAVGFTDDGKPLLDDGIARKAMQEAARLHVPVSFHEEDPAYIVNNGVNAGKAAEFFGIGGSDRQAEISMVRRDLSMALETGARIVIQHISAKEAVELVRQARRKSGRIHAEATPHHFSLTEEAVIEYGTMAKMNPPLREEADRQAIIAGLADGTIDLIATDHAPHSAEEKARPLTEAPSGIIGLETSLSLGIMNLVHTGALSMQRLLACMTVNPASLYGLDAGRIYEGGPADLILFDEKEEWIPGKFHSKSQNSPFLGKKMTGKVKYTVCRGRIVYEDKTE